MLPARNTDGPDESSSESDAGGWSTIIAAGRLADCVASAGPVV
jgi:hypothetical protein